MAGKGTFAAQSFRSRTFGGATWAGIAPGAPGLPPSSGAKKMFAARTFRGQSFIALTWAGPVVTATAKVDGWAAAAAGNTWYARAAPMTTQDIPVAVLRRYADWAGRFYYFDFAALPEVAAGATLSAPIVSVVSGDGSITLGAPSVVGTKVVFAVSGGTAGSTARIEALVTLSSGYPVSWRGDLYTSR